MKKSIIFPLILAALVLGGCANNRYCLEHQPYEGASSIPPLQSADGLTVPQPAGALSVPPLSAKAPRIPFGRKVKSGKNSERVACLDQPPPMPKPQGNEISE